MSSLTKPVAVSGQACATPASSSLEGWAGVYAFLMASRPEPEHVVDVALARSLLLEQFPDLAALPVTELSRGWDNTNFRLGEKYLVRLPHRQVAAPLITYEQRWLPALAATLDMAISAPLFCGEPTAEYPWHWSITPWFEGTEAASATLVDPAAAAATLGDFLRQLHVAAPDDAPPNPYRGCPLADRRDGFMHHIKNLAPEHGDDHDHYDKAALIDFFDAAASQPAATERVWLHGDLHTRNIVVSPAGELAAIIDWGDICSGDRATDLAGAYMLVPDHLHIVQAHAGADEHAWQRARGWAMNFAVIYLANSDDEPVQRSIGQRLLDTLLAHA